MKNDKEMPMDDVEYETKDMSRARRRQLKTSVGKKVFKKHHGFDPDGPIPNKEAYFWTRSARDPKQMSGIYSNTRVPCSCTNCGNPRRHFGEKTRQELIELDYNINDELCDDCRNQISENKNISDEEKESLEYGKKLGIIK
jgi:hypothetical protein